MGYDFEYEVNGAIVSATEAQDDLDERADT
jgi:hypothetical protein